MKIRLEFDLPAEKADAAASVAGPELVSTLHNIDARARSALKYDTDPLEALADIRSIVGEMLERVA